MIKYGLMLIVWVVVGLVEIVCVGMMLGDGVLGMIGSVLVGVLVVMMMYMEYLDWKEESGLNEEEYMSVEWMEGRIERWDREMDEEWERSGYDRDLVERR